MKKNLLLLLITGMLFFLLFFNQPVTIKHCSHFSDIGGVQSLDGGHVNWSYNIQFIAKEAIILDSVFIKGGIYGFSKPIHLEAGKHRLNWGYNGWSNLRPDTLSTNLGRKIFLQSYDQHYFLKKIRLYYSTEKKQYCATRWNFDEQKKEIFD